MSCPAIWDGKSRACIGFDQKKNGNKKRNRTKLHNLRNIHSQPPMSELEYIALPRGHWFWIHILVCLSYQVSTQEKLIMVPPTVFLITMILYFGSDITTTAMDAVAKSRKCLKLFLNLKCVSVKISVPSMHLNKWFQKLFLLRIIFDYFLTINCHRQRASRSYILGNSTQS